MRSSGEKCLYFYIYELLRAFARFGERVSSKADSEIQVIFSWHVLL